MDSSEIAEHATNDHMEAQEQLKQHIEKYDNAFIVDAKPSDESCCTFVIDASKLVASVYDNLTDRFNNEQLQTFQIKVSNIKYSSHERLKEEDFKLWYAKRVELIQIANESIHKLDQSFTTSTIARFLGSCIDLFYNIDDLFDKQITRGLVKQASLISPNISVVTEIFFKYTPYLAYMGLMSSLGDGMNTKITLQRVMEVIREDTELSQKIEPWLTDTEQLDASVKQLFPFGINEDIVYDIEKALASHDCYTKVFAVALLSNIKKNPLLSRNIKFLCELFIFSRSDAACEWYNRTLNLVHPVSSEKTKSEFQYGLLDLAKSLPGISNDISKLAVDFKVDVSVIEGNESQKKTNFSPIENRMYHVKVTPLPQIIQSMLNCVSIYFSWTDLKNNVKPNSSVLLRELSRRAKMGFDKLNGINNINI